MKKPTLVRAGGGGIRPALGGLLAGVGILAGMIAERHINRWFAEHMKEKWEAESLAMVQKAISAKIWVYNSLLTTRRPDIVKALAAGQKVILHVTVDTEWVDTQYGPAQTKATVSSSSLLFEGDIPLEWPLFQKPGKGSFSVGPRVTYRRQVFDFVL